MKLIYFDAGNPQKKKELEQLAKAAGYPDYTVEDFRIPIDGRYTAELGNLCVRGDDRAYTVNAWREQVAGTR